MNLTFTKRGTSRLEVIIVFLILAGIGTIAIPKISKSAENARRNQCDTNVSMLNAAIEMYAYESDSQYPMDNDEFIRNIVNDPYRLPDGMPVCPFGGTYVMDPETKLVYCTHYNSDKNQ